MACITCSGRELSYEWFVAHHTVGMNRFSYSKSTNITKEVHMADNSKSGHKSTAKRDEGRNAQGQFEPGSKAASEAGQKGAANQPTEAKREGGEHSHRSNNEG